MKKCHEIINEYIVFIFLFVPFIVFIIIIII